MRRTIARSLGREAVVIHPAIYGAGASFADYAQLRCRPGHHDQSVRSKDCPIFLETASLPEIEFGVVVGDGAPPATTAGALAPSPTCTSCPTRNIDEVLARTRVLLAPSLWYEGFGLIVMESMLRAFLWPAIPAAWWRPNTAPGMSSR
jgi:glycosyltransferase involved in cell wall biosynthesis